jgi:hypothetical protein
LECGRVILTVPSETVRQLDDPTQLAKFWDEVVRLEDELAGTPHLRKRPERIVPDVQISAGYMHSGYPIMTHLDVAGHVTNLAKIQAGSWGHFHESRPQPSVGRLDLRGHRRSDLQYLLSLCDGEAMRKATGQGHDAMEPGKGGPTTGAAFAR